jgi:hypothetical protein
VPSTEWQSLGNFRWEIGVDLRDYLPLTILVDNQAAIKLANTSVFSRGVRHIRLRYAYVNELVQTGRIRIEYVPTKKNIADLFTKALERGPLREQVDRLMERMPILPRGPRNHH